MIVAYYSFAVVGMIVTIVMIDLAIRKRRRQEIKEAFQEDLPYWYPEIQPEEFNLDDVEKFKTHINNRYGTLKPANKFGYTVYEDCSLSEDDEAEEY